MWKAVCQTCGWASGEAYVQSVAEVIGEMHEVGDTGRKTVLKQARTFENGLEEKEGSGPQESKPSKP